MPKVRVRERKASPEEWADETRRIQAAREQHRPLAPRPKDNRTFAAAEPDARQLLLDGLDAATALNLRATYGKNGRPELPAVRQ